MADQPHHSSSCLALRPTEKWSEEKVWVLFCFVYLGFCFCFKHFLAENLFHVFWTSWSRKHIYFWAFVAALWGRLARGLKPVFTHEETNTRNLVIFFFRVKKISQWHQILEFPAIRRINNPERRARWYIKYCLKHAMSTFGKGSKGMNGWMSGWIDGWSSESRSYSPSCPWYPP